MIAIFDAKSRGVERLLMNTEVPIGFLLPTSRPTVSAETFMFFCRDPLFPRIAECTT